MDEIVLKAQLDESTYLYISPISRETYEEHIEDDSLGGDRGYFVLRSRRTGAKRLEVLAKVASMEAATDLFNMIMSTRRATTARQGL